MKVGITVWDDRISPVFDAARALLIVEIEGSQAVSRKLLPCIPAKIGDFVGLLQEQGVHEVICGAISNEPAAILEAHNIGLIPFIAGMIEPVLTAYAGGKSIDTFRMPGCCGSNRCGRIDWYRSGSSEKVFPQIGKLQE